MVEMMRESIIQMLKDKIKSLQITLDDEFIPSNIKGDVHKKQDLLRDILEALSY